MAEVQKKSKTESILGLILGLIIGAGSILGYDFTKQKEIDTLGDAIPVILQDGTEVLAIILKKEVEDEPKPVEDTE